MDAQVKVKARAKGELEQELGAKGEQGLRQGGGKGYEMMGARVRVQRAPRDRKATRRSSYKPRPSFPNKS